MPDHDSLALAAALLASGAKPPRVLTTLSEVFKAYHDHDQNGGPVPHVVLSPQLAKLFREIEEKRGLTADPAAAARQVARAVVDESRRGEPGPIRVEYVNDWRGDQTASPDRKETP